MFWIWRSCLLFLLEWKFSFWANLIQKFKMVCLSWNLVLRLIQIENCMVTLTFFWFVLEKPSSSSMWISATMFIFSLLEQKYNFWKNWSHIIKSVVGFALSCLIWLSPVFVSVTKIKFLKMFQLCRAFC